MLNGKFDDEQEPSVLEDIISFMCMLLSLGMVAFVLYSGITIANIL